VPVPLFYRWLNNSEEAIIYGIQRVRLVGINAPEIGEEGYEEAKEFVKTTCWGEEVKLDVDDMKQYDTYYRILAVVYVNETNLNEKLVRGGYAEIMFVPPSMSFSVLESFLILVFAIIVALIVSIVLPERGQQKFWAKFLGQKIAYSGGGRVATFIIVLIIVIVGYILLRITPG
jgi:hypothetical protein